MSIPINLIYSELITNKEAYSKWLDCRRPGYSEYRDKWFYNPQNYIVEDFPLNLDIEPSNKCNLKCPFCYRTLAIDNNSSVFDHLGDMSLTTFREIIKQIVKNGKCMVPAIKLTHRGEPLLNSDIFAMIAEAKNAGALDVIMNTNATLLNEENAELLFSSGLDKLLISIDSSNKEMYEKTRVGASFDNVIANVKNAVNLRNKLNANGTLIRIGMVLTKETISQKEEFIKFFVGIADIVSFNKVHEEVEIDDDGNFTLSSGNVYNVYDHKFTDSQLWQRMTVNWNGDVEICCENYKQEYKLNNIFSSSISEIWTSEAFNYVRKIHMNGEYYKIPQCKKCTFPYIDLEK